MKVLPIIAFSALAALAGCNSGSSSGGGNGGDQGQEVDFSTLITQVFAQDANAEPVPVNGRDIDDDGSALQVSSGN